MPKNNDTVLDRPPKSQKTSKTEPPKKYSVSILDDDQTTFAAVEDVLQSEFNKSAAEARAISYTVHTQGKGLVDIYTSKDIAETKADNGQQYMRLHYPKYPLQFSVERAPD